MIDENYAQGRVLLKTYYLINIVSSIGHGSVGHSRTVDSKCSWIQGCKWNLKNYLFSYIQVFCVDTGIEFSSTSFVYCRKELQEWPSFALNTSLAGVSFNNLDQKILEEFLGMQKTFSLKVILINKLRYVVEIYNDQMVCLNYLLNPNYQKEIFIHNKTFT